MKSLMLKMMVIFGTMVLIVCGVFLGFTVYTSSENLSAVAEENLLAIRDSWGIAISDNIGDEQYLLETIARRTTLIDENFTMAQRLDYVRPDLEAGRGKGFLNFGLILPNGTVYSTDGSILDVSAQDYFKVPMEEGRVYASDPIISRFGSSEGDIIRVSSVPLRDTNNRVVGVLMVMKDGEVLSNLVAELEANISGSGAIISMDTGEIVAHVDYKRVMANIIEEAKSDPAMKDFANVIVRIMNGETGTAEYETNGVERLSLFAPIVGTQWGLFVYNDLAVIQERTTTFTITMTIFTIIILGICLGVTFFIARNISSPIKYATEQIQYFANRDFSFENKIQLYRNKKDETGTIARSLYTLQISLTNAFKDIFTATQQVTDGSRQISTSSQSVSSIASEQAASTEEISATMEEMASNIKQNADNASKTGSISKQAVENAHKGQQAVNESLEAVRKIASEISIIGGIASQTNLLALNAAIEAARAGDAGKGFAVVASEVRKLAEKSQIAATEINVLSSTTIIAAEKANEVISSVIPGIEQTASLIEEISFASREQDSGAQQVNKALVQMDVSVQQNASSSEELASMAEELSSQAMATLEILSSFKLSNEGSDHVQQPQAASRTHIQAPIISNQTKIPKKKANPSNGAQSYHGSSSVDNNEFEEF